MRRAVRWAMRGLLLALLVTAGLDPSLPDSGPRRRVYLVDASSSVSRSGTADAFTPEDALRLATHDAATLDRDDQVALVAFGSKTVVLVPISPAGSAKIPARVEGVDASSTDLAAALELAAALADGGEVVLFSDGRSTAGRVPVERLRVPVHPFPLGPLGGVDASIQVIDAPATVPSGGEFTIRVTVEATGAWRGEWTAADRKQPLEFTGPGRQDIVLSFQMNAGGQPFTVDVRLAGETPDACPENDAATLTVFPEAQSPRILIVCAGRPSALAGVFREPRWSPTVARDLRSAAEADVILIERMPAGATSRAELERLVDLVEEQGAGLVALGGSASYALGGWGETPLENLLPFWAFPDERSAVVVALDRSGSMAEPAAGRTRPRLEEASAAVRRALELAHPDDELALVTFADSAELRCPLVPGRDRGRAAAALQHLSAGGGTVLAGALEMAAATVKTSKAGRRRILLVSDGRSEREEAALKNLGTRLRDEGIGLTVIRIGESSTPALDALRSAGAEELDGSDFGTLDERLAGALARSRDFTSIPEVGMTFLDRLQGLQEGAKPGLVNRVSMKPGSESLGRIGPAIFAAYRPAGRGKATATTVSFEEGWVGGLASWPDRAAFVTRLAEAVAPAAPRLPADVSLRFEGDQLTITAAIRGTERDDQLKLMLDGAPLTLPRRGENFYEKSVLHRELSATVRVDGRIAAVARRPHALEFDRVGPDVESLQSLAQGTGGKRLEAPRDLADLPGRRPVRPRSARPLLLGAALALFLLEIAVALLPSRRGR